jgi:rubrerythrin
MTLTKKERDFLKDLQNEEKLCVEKYRKAAQAACDPALQKLFGQIEQGEQQHYNIVTQMLDGKLPQQQAAGKGQQARQKQAAPQKAKVSRAEKQSDAYLLGDLLGTEKYVSAVYNTAVFEFSDAQARQALADIQLQEQGHGKALAEYMQVNGMYC